MHHSKWADFLCIGCSRKNPDVIHYAHGLCGSCWRTWKTQLKRAAEDPKVVMSFNQPMCRICGARPARPIGKGVNPYEVLCLAHMSKSSTERSKLVGKKYVRPGTGKDTATKHIAACVSYKKRYIEKHGFVSCENCGVSQCFKFEVHHIYYASRYPKHENLHNDRNLILLCADCHVGFHSHKPGFDEKFAKIEEERGLKELFQKSP